MTKKQNLEFQLTFCENNLRYLLGDPTPNKELIDFNRGEIKRIKNELEKTPILECAEAFLKTIGKWEGGPQ